VILNNKVKKILLADDEPDITFTIKLILKEIGFQIDTFNDPIAALKSYRTNFYDLVILDIKMPRMDGCELYNIIREQDTQVKICFLTAIARFNEEFRKIRLALGKAINEDYFIQKPIKTEDLIRKLTSIMNIDIITMPI
jgi:DNA-binding response OmpR family regulator